MRFHADLHIHSKYSRATSRDLDLEHLAWWAMRKGITVVGTGDFTHPAWRAELKEKLVPAEPGLFRLKPDLEQKVASELPAAAHGAVRFMLSVEISTIYKKGEKTRKIHHLLYAPDFAAADRIATKLASIGNVASDGRPILGLDSRNLLEITLEADRGAYLVPAHIWTPWFAVLGSQSGFDSITDCYGDLAPHVFALETGLSSDPPMNWRLSFLDRFRLVSNSDAHSPGKLGRETTLYDTELDFFALRKALETGQGYVGTVEFFPEEGKYHLDGHRKCEARLTPKETLANGGLCPVCGKPVTVGVLHRVDALADREEDRAPPPQTAGAVSNLVPLPEILSEIAGSGPASKTVERHYDRLISTLGPELEILQSLPLEDIARADSSVFAEAIKRLRAGQVTRDAGYDGEYGRIRLFEDRELRRATAGGILFDIPIAQPKPAPLGDAAPSMPAAKAAKTPPEEAARRAAPRAQAALIPPSGMLAGLDDDQRAAAAITTGPLLIVAGPGSGKTRVLTHRIAHLVAEGGAPAEACLAITFTRRAAAEMRDRLAVLLPGTADRIPIHTFHSLGLAILREQAGTVGLHRGFRIASEDERLAALIETLDVSEWRAQTLLRAISMAKRTLSPPDAEISDAVTAYRNMMTLRNWVDFDDLIGLALRTMSEDAGIAALYRNRFPWISVDEFQDVDEQQYRLLRLIAPADANLCVIGDPDQAIYGFRGADASCFRRFGADYPDARTISLKRNYRSSGTIVAACAQVITSAEAEPAAAEIVRAMEERILIHIAPTERAEAEFVVHTIEQMIGGHSFFSIDSGRTDDTLSSRFSFADFAVLYRTDAQSAALVEALARSGMPFQKTSHAALSSNPIARRLLRDTVAVPGAEGKGLIGALVTAAQRLAADAEADDALAVKAALQRLTALAESCGRDVLRFSDAAALASEADFWDPRADRVSLQTLHAAKGLEFPVVFIVGCEDGLLPFHWGEADAASLAEERRLAYVGMTRAKDRLILSRALQRHWRGGLRKLEPSPFLADIERELVKQQRAALRAKPAEKQLKLF
ncbi:MAG TPA: UvrD-helicase domain-containing protein [Stellaceae bacterium]|nr:UvrD-helicase domain-containing protein [Stellaceae bacterium]